MTPDFALSLSQDGIDLLHRTTRGWRRVGHAKINSATLDADLAEMRETAAALSTDGLTTKLVIPADQIKYTAIDSTQTAQSDIDAILDGATPYPLEALVVDCERFGGRTHIAAVARETLAEAESFANAHGFRPVAFVAIPPPFTFQKEVFFGPTSMMPAILGDQGTVTGDSLPVMIVGTRLKSRLLIMGDITSEPEETIADLFAARQIAPAKPAPPTGWVDAVPPEHWPMPTVAQDSVAVPLTPPALAQLPLFDLIIPEVHPRTVSHPKAVVVAAPAAPKRAVPAAPPTSTTKPWALVAGLVLAGAVGTIAWTQLNAPRSGGETAIQIAPVEIAPVEIAQVEIAQVQITQAPQPPATQVATLSSPVLSETPLLTAGQSSAPVPATTPAIVPASTPDTVPQPPQAPPAPAAPRNTATAVMPSPAQAAEIYAATGVWQRAPRFVDVPSGTDVLDFSRPTVPAAPARVLQSQTSLQPATRTILPFASPAEPPRPGVTFVRDADGFIAATPEGTLTPQGALVFAGRPDIAMQLRPTLTEAELARMALLAPAPSGVVIIAGAPPTVPPLRPADLFVAQQDSSLAETVAAASTGSLGGVGLGSLELQDNGSVALDSNVIEAVARNDLRPRLRPEEFADASDLATPDITDILTEIAAADATLRFDNSTSLAVRASVRPALRPSGFSNVVTAALRPAAPSQPAASVAAAAPVAPQNFEPVPGGVARAATQEDVIRLRDINLIGVYGRPNARRALVRLGNGRYVRVEVGSELDGGQVTAIGDEALNYVKRGRTYAVELPGA